MRQKILFISILLTLIAGCGKNTSTQQKKPFRPRREYNLSVVVGPQFYWGLGAKKFAEMVNKRTNGTIKIKPCYGGQLFKGAQTSEFQLLSQGVIDFAWGSTINWSPVIKELNIFSLPFFINTYTALDKLENSKTGEKLFELMEAKGVKPLAWAENGFRQLTNSKRSIKTPSDVAGMKIRVVGSPIFIDIFTALKADPVSMNWGDAISAFSQGVVDGQENPAGILLPVKIWEYHSHLFLWNYVVDPVIVAVNKKTWAGFPDNIKKIIKECAVRSARWEKATVRAGLDDGTALDVLKNEFSETSQINYIDFLRSKNMVVSTINEKEKNEFLKIMKPVYDKWMPKIGMDFYNTARNE